MLLFGKKAKLLRSVEKLAIYNDKGIAWANHSETQVAEHRAALVAQINQIVAEIERTSLPKEFLAALGSDALGKDGTGRFYE